MGHTSDLAARTVSKRSTTRRGGFSRAKTWVIAAPFSAARTETASEPAAGSTLLSRI
jgi:hypothetical protein